MPIESERPFRNLAIAPVDRATDHIMMCGGMAMLQDLRVLLDRRGFESSPGVGEPGHDGIERAFGGSREPDCPALAQRSG